MVLNFILLPPARMILQPSAADMADPLKDNRVIHFHAAGGDFFVLLEPAGAGKPCCWNPQPTLALWPTDAYV